MFLRRPPCLRATALVLGALASCTESTDSGPVDTGLADSGSAFADAAIADLVQAAALNGGIVTLPAGTYEADTLIIPAGVSISGSGETTIIRAETIVVMAGSNPVAIDNLAVEGIADGVAVHVVGSTDSSDTVSLTDVRIRLNQGVGLSAQNVENFHVSGLSIQSIDAAIPVDNYPTAIELTNVGTDSSRAEFTDTHINQFGPWGYNVVGGVIAIERSSVTGKSCSISMERSDVTIEDTMFDVTGASDETVRAIYSGPMTRLSVSEATFAGDAVGPMIVQDGSIETRYSNLRFEGGGDGFFWSQQVTQVSLSGLEAQPLQISSMARYGIVILGGTSAEISHVAIDGVADPTLGDGIFIGNTQVVAITNTTVANAARVGILLDGIEQLSTSTFSNVTVDALSTGYGAIAQDDQVLAIDAWGAGIMRDGDALSRDPAVTTPLSVHFPM